MSARMPLYLSVAAVCSAVFSASTFATVERTTSTWGKKTVTEFRLDERQARGLYRILDIRERPNDRYVSRDELMEKTFTNGSLRHEDETAFMNFEIVKGTRPGGGARTHLGFIKFTEFEGGERFHTRLESVDGEDNVMLLTIENKYRSGSNCHSQSAYLGSCLHASYLYDHLDFPTRRTRVREDVYRITKTKVLFADEPGGRHSRLTCEVYENGRGRRLGNRIPYAKCVFRLAYREPDPEPEDDDWGGWGF